MKAKTTLTFIFVFFVMSVWAQTNQQPVSLYEKFTELQAAGQAPQQGSPTMENLSAEEDSILQVKNSLKEKIQKKAPRRTQKVQQQQQQTQTTQRQQPIPIKRHKFKTNSAASDESSSNGNQTVTFEKDNPQARADFELLKTRDIKTGEIPNGIRANELSFMRAQNQKIGIPFATGDLLSPWINRGPHNVGGRTRALAVDVNDENIILAGGISGGMWRSVDQGATWSKTTGSNELQSVSCVIQDTRMGQTSTWYYGTGEVFGNSAGSAGAPYSGDGIYKSTDNGATWTLLTSTESNTPQTFDQGFDYNYELVVNPTNGDLLVSNYFGVYLSTDGGATFTLTLENSGFTGVWGDLIMTSTGNAYAVIDNRGVYSSSDGTNWTNISSGSGLTFSSGERKELALAPSNENVFYLISLASGNASGHALLRFDDSTDSWTDLSANIPQLGGQTGNFDSQGGYDLLIKVKPDDENFVVIGGTNLFASSDGFSSTNNTSWIGGYSATNSSFGLYTNHHPDQHSFVFLTNNRALSGNDGGVQITNDVTDITTNGSQETVDWISLNNGYLTTQVYALSAGPGDQIMAGFQDNSTWLTTSVDSDANWTDQFGGDGAYNAFNSDGSVRYMSSQNGNIFRVNYAQGADDIGADGFTEFDPAGYSAGLFIVPFYLDPINNDLFYLAGNSTFYVNTQASTGSSSVGWKTIPLGGSGVVSEIGVTGSNIVYLGTSAGELFKVEDPGGSEVVTNVTGSNFSSGYISGVGVNQKNSDEILVSFSNYSMQSVFYSNDGGSNWTNVSGTLEENADGSGSGPSVRSARILGDGDRYFVGTSTGLYSTTAISGDATVWNQENSSGIGDVVVEHLVTRADGLVLAGTHGNGIYSSKFEVTGQSQNDLALTGIVAPEPLVSGVEAITVSLENLGTAAQSGFELTYFVNEVEVSTETVSETVQPTESLDFTFTNTFDFSEKGEYVIRVDLTSGDEVAGNNSVSKFAVNALFTGTYVLQQTERTASGPSTAFSDGYLFGNLGTDVITLFYVDEDTRGAFGVYLPQFHDTDKFFEWDLINGDVIFADNQTTGLSCGGNEVLLGTADNPGAYTIGDDSEFTITVKEDLVDNCGTGSPDVTFLVKKQVDNDLAVVSINSPNDKDPTGQYPVTVTILNAGANPQSNFEMSFFIDGNLIATEEINETFESGTLAQYTFDTEVEFEDAGNYEIKATITLAGDERTANDELVKSIEIIEFLGFEGPYILQQIAPTTSSASAAFANGYLFNSTGTNSVFIENLGDGNRQFSEIYLPTFNSNRRNYRFSLVGTETIFNDNQDTGVGCGTSILLGTADTQGSFDIADDNQFTLNIKEDLLDGCGQGTVDVAFSLTKAPEYHDLAVIDITSPNEVFPNTNQFIQAAVHSFSNVPEGDFDLTYFVNDVEVATETVVGGINIDQTIFFNFQNPFDFSTPGLYDIRVEVNLPGDEFTDNDFHVKSVESLEPIADFPYLETFDNDGGALPLGWLNNFGWNFSNTASPSTTTGPLGDNTSGSGYYLLADSHVSSESNVDTRHIDLSVLNSPLFTFYYHMFGTPTSTLEVQVNNRPIYSISGEQQLNQGDPYQRATVNLSEFGDQTVTIRLVSFTSGGNQEIVAVDDIGMEEALDHDLSVSTIMSPANIVTGEESISVTIVNLGRRAQSEFNVSYYVNEALISTELFADIIGSGQSLDFTFDTPFDYSGIGVYDLKVEVDLPADELLENNAFERSVVNPGDRLPFTGTYQLEQLGQTTAGPSSAFASGFLFSGTNLFNVDLVYIDENTRNVSLSYLSEFGSPFKDYEFTMSNGEVVFTDNQLTDQACTNGILLGSADVSGSFDMNDDTEFFLTVKEDVSADCGVGSEDVTFILRKQSNTFEYDLAVTSINTPQNNIPISRQAIGFVVENTGVLPQGDFDATYFVNDVAVSTETFTQPFRLRAGSGRVFTFNVPFEFAELAVYDVRVELTRAADDNPTNDVAFTQIQTSAFNINAVPINNNQVGIEWAYLSDVSSVVLERSTDADNFEDLAIIDAADTHFVDDTVDPDVLYYYRLRGTIPSGEMNFSILASAQATIEGDFAFNKVLGDITGVDLSNNTYSSSWSDLDGDGDLDMVVSNIPNFNVNLSLADAPSIYLNDGDGNFEKVPDNTVISDGVSSRSASVIDYNNDGQPDVFLSGYNSRIGDFRNRLFRNNGNMDFTSNEVPTFRKTFNSEEGSWADVDNDGDLDLFVAGFWSAGNVNFIYENKGAGRFESIRSGTIYESLYNTGLYSWGASWVDYDNDGDQDLYIPIDANLAGSQTTAKLFRNNGDEGFEEITDLEFLEPGKSIRGAQWADLDQNGSLDLLMVETNVTPIFFFNDGAGNFTKVSSMDALGQDLNVHRISTVGDINNNGKLDIIFASRGYFVYESNNDQTFTLLENVLPEIETGLFAGISLADMDSDGDLDMFRGNASSGYSFNLLYENQGNSNNWLHIDLKGEFSNADGIGTKIELTTGSGTQYRTVTSSTGLMGQNSLITEFGLGLNTMVDHIKVIWPTGTVKEFFEIAANQLIEIDDSNAPTDVGLSNAIIPENLAGGSAVGASFSVDIDAEDAHTYEIVSTGGQTPGGSNKYVNRDKFSSLTDLYSPTTRNAMSISENDSYQVNADSENFFIENGTIKAATNFDFETQSSYSIRVRTVDAFGNTFEKVIGIDILDVNEDIVNSSPTDLTLSATRINENESENSTIGMLTATDSDEGSTHTFSLVDGDASAFVIDGNTLTTSSSFNFESKESYTITIRTIDDGGLSFDKEYIISVDDVNEEPIELFLDNDQLTEGLVSGSLVGALSTVDTDNNDTHTYSLSGTDAASFQILGDELLTLSPLDFESQTIYEITLTSTDGGGLTVSKDYEIQISDENDAPGTLTASSTEINEMRPEGSVIATLSTTDDDLTDTHTYSLSGPDAASFKVLGDELRTREEFNFESLNVYDIVLTVTDDRGLSFSSEFVINVTDVNDEPSELTLSNSSVPETLAAGTAVGVFSTVDEDSGDSHTFSFVSGTGDDDNTSFALNNSVLETAEQFDFETKNVYTIRMAVSDGNGGSFEQQFSIDISDINEASPNVAPSDISLTANTVAEDAAIGSVVGSLSTTDADAGDTHTYSFVNGASSLFTINGDQLETNATFNFELIDSYSVTIRSTDAGGLIFDEEYTIVISNINEAPNSLTLSNDELSEGESIGFSIGTLTTLDDDAGDTQSYSLSGTDAANFQVVGGELQSAVEFDFETQSVHEVTVTVTDAGGLFLSEDFSIEVTDTNEAPSAIALTANSLSEGLSLGTVIGDLSTTDTDAGDSHTYSLSGADASSFIIVIDELRSAEVFDFESKASYDITVTTTDNGGLTSNTNLSIDVLDANDAPTAISIDSEVIAEKLTSGTTVGTLSLTDEDANDTESYVISGIDASSFAISDNLLQSSSEFDFEAKSSYNITITGSDGNNESIAKDFVITISDVNDAPTALALSNTTINEGASISTVVGTIEIEDPDAVDTHTYMLSGADAANFQIVGAELQSAVEFDFEGQSVHEVTITATDAGGLTFDQNLSVTIADVNEAPTEVALSTTSIAEGEALGSVVGNLSSVDVDAGDTHTYSLSGTDAGSFQVANNELTTAEVFDFESKASYDVTVTTTDAGGLNISSVITITVLDANDAPTALSLSNEAIDEGGPSGTVIGTLALTDEDANDTETFTLSGTDAASFQIVSNELQSSGVLNFESQATYSISVLGSDGAGESVSNDFTITVADINEAPTTLALSSDVISEGMASDTPIGEITFEDEDAGDTHTISLTGDDAASFKVAGTELQSAEEFNFEVKSTYAVTIVVTDAGGLETNSAITVNVTDANDAPSAISLSNLEIAEEEAVGTVIGILAVADEDAADTHTLTLSGDESSSFEIVGNELRSTEIFDFDAKSSYTVTVEASDGELSVIEDFVITIVNVLGIDNNDHLVNVYPNPSNGIFTVSLDKSLTVSKWNLYDLKGNTIQTANSVIQQSVSSMTLDVSNLPAGQYILEIINETERITKQVIIIH